MQNLLKASLVEAKSMPTSKIVYFLHAGIDHSRYMKQVNLLENSRLCFDIPRYDMI